MERNRETLVRVIRELQGVTDDDALAMAAFDCIYQAIADLNEAMRYALDADEVRELAERIEAQRAAV